MKAVPSEKAFAALGDPVRLAIVRRLLRRESCICELTGCCAKDQSVIFRHVKLLEDAGIVVTRKDGKYLRCTIKDPVALKRLLAAAAAFTT